MLIDQEESHENIASLVMSKIIAKFRIHNPRESGDLFRAEPSASLLLGPLLVFVYNGPKKETKLSLV
jgi:hypothetical protein